MGRVDRVGKSTLSRDGDPSDVVYKVSHDRFPMRDTNHAIIIVITSHLLCPRLRSVSSTEKKCQTVILPRVIEKSSCDPVFYLNVLNVRESIERAGDPDARRRASCDGIGKRTDGRLSSIQIEAVRRERAAEILRQEALQCSTDNL